MEIKDLASELALLSKQYCQAYGINRTSDWLLLKLGEEVGELFQSYLKYQGQTRNTLKGTTGYCLAFESLENELADVLGMVLVLADEFNLDINAGLDRKWFRHKLTNPKLIDKLTDKLPK